MAERPITRKLSPIEQHRFCKRFAVFKFAWKARKIEEREHSSRKKFLHSRCVQRRTFGSLGSLGSFAPFILRSSEGADRS